MLPHGWRSLLREPSRTLLETEDVPPFLAATHAVPQLGIARPRTKMVDAIPLAGGAQTPLLALFASTMEYDDVIYSAMPLGLAFDDGKERSPAVLRRRSRARERVRARRCSSMPRPTTACGSHWPARCAKGRRSPARPERSRRSHVEFGRSRTCGRRKRAPARHAGPAPCRRHRRRNAAADHLSAHPRGLNPEIEIARFLHEAGFAHSPPLLGTLIYDGRDGDVDRRRHGAPLRAQSRQRLGCHPNVSPPLSRTAPRDADPRNGGHRRQRHRLLRSRTRRAGERLASLHLALAASNDPAFVPEPVSTADRADWVAASQRRASFVITQLSRAAATAAPALRADIAELLRAQSRLNDAIASSSAFDSSIKIRIHGDLHLARYLVTEADLLIVDPGAGDEFLPPAERRRKAVPLRDLARMIRSLEAAAAFTLRDVAGDRTENAEHFERELTLWTARTAEAFLAGYEYGVKQTILDVGDPAAFRSTVAALAFHDAVDALAIALAENSSSLDFYVRNLSRRMPA